MGYYPLNLDELRKKDQGRLPKQSFQHQIDAFEALSRVFTFNDNRSKGGLLVLPTGAGKTFTAIKWLGDNALPRNIKILWLAHSFYLLDQAYAAFLEYASWIPEIRKTLNIRLVSSNPGHDRVSSIQLTDDIVIMTTQTAIKNLNTTALDNYGRIVTTNFRKFIEHCKQTGLFVVLDEAHHAPAYGCRNLLVGKQQTAPGIREIVPNLYLLGLTATPTYSDETRRGWLGKIFEQGIVHETQRIFLIQQKILARPRYIEMPTGREFEIDDNLYTRLQIERKELPEYIIQKLADDSPRNDYIVNEYVKHRGQYGKTIIFADRWFQCVYLKTKLLEKGVRADAVYSKIEADPGSPEARNQRTESDNARILKEFKDDKLDVLINVRMLTEGVDVPDVKTVFITRQTTSSILMQQMIGRALRGERAGGKKDEANIVLFVDEWKRLINWASPVLEGGVEEGRPQVRGYYPLEYIAIRLVEELSRQINSGTPPSLPFLHYLPVGWYQTEIVVNTSEEHQEHIDEIQSFTEFAIVYEHTKPKFDKFIAAVSKNIPDEWGKEDLAPEWMMPQVNKWIDEYFDREKDDLGNTLDSDLIKIARHIAQKQIPPAFHSFEERDKYDLDKLARQLLDTKPRDQHDILSQEFSKPGSLWRDFYRSFDRFQMAFQGALVRVVNEIKYGPTSPPILDPPPPIPPINREPTEAEKKQVKIRDNYTCLSCGAKEQDIRLEIDHIKPFNMGGETSVDNSQTLCHICNKEKGINEINFRFYSTQLPSPKQLKLLSRYGMENVKFSITRLVNFFYHCQAVCQVDLCETSWEIELYAGNNPDWLLQYKERLLAHIQQNFNCPQVKDIRIRGIHPETSSDDADASPSTPPLDFPNFKPPQNPGSREEWEKSLHHAINYFYGCAAVKTIRMSFLEWHIEMHPGNNLLRLRPHLKDLIKAINRETDLQKIKQIRVSAADQSDVVVTIEPPVTVEKPLPPVRDKKVTRGQQALPPDGTACRFQYKNQLFEGKITGGKLVIPGQGTFTSFSAASHTLAGTPRNGWLDWELQLAGSESWIPADEWRKKNLVS